MPGVYALISLISLISGKGSPFGLQVSGFGSLLVPAACGLKPSITSPARSGSLAGGMTYAPPTRGLAFTSRFCATSTPYFGASSAGSSESLFLIRWGVWMAGASWWRNSAWRARLQGPLQGPDLEDRLRP